MDARQPAQLQKRNVEVVDSTGAIIAGLWQYGTLDWQEFYGYLTAFIVTREDWLIFQFDSTRQQHGAPCPQGPQIVQPGHYILLSTAGAPITVGLVATLAPPRNPTLSTTPLRVSNQSDLPDRNATGSPPFWAHHHDYRTRGRARDGKCLITGLQTQTYSRLKVAHIFPRVHDTEWVRKGYPSKITDTADEACMGGPTKIDSVQNVVTLRGDLHDAWDNYEFGVNPNNNYRITAFTNGNADINGLRLHLDHIQDPNLRPLDELFADHFVQGLFKHMRGAAEPEWTYEDYDDAFGSGSFDMSNPKIWKTREGKEQLEFALADRLFDHRVSQQSIG